MVTWKLLASAVHALRYFRTDWEFRGIAGSFSGDTADARRERRWRRQATHWYGKGAAALGLRGPVKAARFQAVLEGRVPGTDLRLGRVRRGAAPAAGSATAADPAWQHRPGGDLTCSAPKSVSLEALVYARPRTRARILRAHDEAVRETADFAEQEFLQTRTYDRATGRRPRIQAHGLVAACFRHLASRDLDPQLHTHTVFLNLTRDAQGAWRSVDFTPLNRAGILFGAVYRTALQRRLEALGYATVATLVGTTPGFEIAGYPKTLLDCFSQRRRAILDWIERQGHVYSTRIAQFAALVTRRHKREPGRADLDARWSARASDYGPGRDWEAARGRSGPPAPPAPAALEVVRRALEHLEARQTVFARSQLRGWALAHAGGRHDLAAIDHAIGVLEQRERLLVPTERQRLDAAYTTRRAPAAESAILAQVRAGVGTGVPVADAGRVAAHLGMAGLTAGQRAAAELVLLAPHRIVGVQGHAGTGKTALLRTVAAHAAGRPVLALAPSAAATRILGAATGLPARTLAWFLARYREVGEETASPDELEAAREALAGALVIVDEASMIGNTAMRLLLGITDRADVARVALVGDRRQLPSVEAGTPFRLMQDRGLPTATMAEILRQRTPGLQAVVRHLLARKPELAIDALGADAIEIGAGDDTTAEAAARLWLELSPEDRAGTAIVAPTHAERAEIAAVIRAGLAAEGVLRGHTLTIDRYVNLHLTRAEKGDLAHYRLGDIAVFHVDLRHLRIHRDDACQVRAVEGDRVVLAHPDGTARHIRPDSEVRYRLEVYEPRPIDLRAGDRIRWTRPDLELEVDNGALATITAIDRHRVRFRGDAGRTYSLTRAAPQLHHVDYAYSTTVHGAQGMTCDAVIAVLDAGRGASPDQAAVYVELTHARDAAVLLTDDREALVDALEDYTGERPSVLEAAGALLDAAPPPPAKPRLQPEPIAWEAFAESARARGQHPFAAAGHEVILAPVLTLADRPPGTAPAVALRVAADHRTWVASQARKRARDALRAALVDRTAALAGYLEGRVALAADPGRGGTGAAAGDAYALLLEQADAALAAARALEAWAGLTGPDDAELADRHRDLRVHLRTVANARERDAGALAGCRRLAALDRAAAAAGSHRCHAPDYGPLVAAIRDLETALLPGDRLVPALAAVPAEAAQLAVAGARLRQFVVHTVPTFLEERARAEREARRIGSDILSTDYGRGDDTGRGAATRRVVVAADGLLRDPACRPHLDADPERGAWIAAVRAALLSAGAFEERAHALLRELRRCPPPARYGDPDVAAGYGRIVAGVRSLAAERRRLPRVPPALAHGARGAPYPGAGEPLVRIPAPLTAFREQYLAAASRRMALRTRLAGRLDALVAQLVARAHLLRDAARRRCWVAELPAYPAWRQRSRPLARRLFPDAMPNRHDDPPDWLAREPLWARCERRRQDLEDTLRRDRRAAAASRAMTTVTRRAAAAGVHAAHLPEGRRLARAIASLEQRAATPGELPGALAAFRAEVEQLADSARALGAFVGTTVPAIVADHARLESAAAYVGWEFSEVDSAGYWTGSVQSAIRTGQQILIDPHCRPHLEAVPAFRAWVGDAVVACRAVAACHADARSLHRRQHGLEHDAPGWERRQQPEADALAAAITQLEQRIATLPDVPRGVPSPPGRDQATRAGALRAYDMLAADLPPAARYGTLRPALPRPLAAFQERWQEIGPLIDQAIRIDVLVAARTGTPAPTGPPDAARGGGDADGSQALQHRIAAADPPSGTPGTQPADAAPTAANLRTRLQTQRRALAAALAMDGRVLRCRHTLVELDRAVPDTDTDRFLHPQHPGVVARTRDLYAAYRGAPSEQQALYVPWPRALAALLANDRTRVDAAAAGIRRYVADTVPDALRTRAGLDDTVRARGGLAGPRDAAAYPAWQARAAAVIREGELLAAATGGMAVVLDAEPGRREWIAKAVAFLTDTLAFDDRAHDLLQRCRRTAGRSETAIPGTPSAATPDPSILDNLRVVVKIARALQARRPAAPPGRAPEAAPRGPAADTAPVCGDTPSPLPLPAPVPALLAAAGGRRSARHVALQQDELPHLRCARDERDRLRRDATESATALTEHHDYGRWHRAATIAIERASALLGDDDAWLEAYHPLPAGSAPAREQAAELVTALERSIDRDRTAQACTAAVIGHAMDAIDDERAPYAGPEFLAIVTRVREVRQSALDGEFPPMLEPVAAAPNSLQAAHARIWRLGTIVLPDLEARVARRQQLCGEAVRGDCGVTELPDYADWDQQAVRTASAVPGVPELQDPAAELHWDVVRHRSTETIARTRLREAADAIDRAAAIDRQARTLLDHPFCSAAPARAGAAQEYEKYVAQIDTLKIKANQPGEMPPALVQTAGTFRSWQTDQARTGLADTVIDRVQRSRHELDGAGSGDTPFGEADPERHRRWREQLRAAAAAEAELRQQRQRTGSAPRGRYPPGYSAARRTVTFLRRLDRLPACTLQELQEAIADAPAREVKWFRSEAAKQVVQAWRDVARARSEQASSDPLETPVVIRNLIDAQTLHEQAVSMQSLADQLEDHRQGGWLVDPMDGTWPKKVKERIDAARTLVEDEPAFMRLRQRFPELTEALIRNLETVSQAFEEHRTRTGDPPSGPSGQDGPRVDPFSGPPEKSRSEPERRPSPPSPDPTPPQRSGRRPGTA